ncbi:MAG: glycosyltransferase [Actinomycetota bacterium]|jgi:glycosyltransferase involved in cell wall biosynthesis|nr:glycosyltransferase [Actinomycetota bacterium]
MRIDQYLPGFAPFDAIGGHTLMARKVLREAGYQSEIWAEHILAPLGSEARPYHEDTHRAGEGRVLIFHTSTSSPMSAWIRARAEAGELVLGDYHNITPGKYFERWEPAIAAVMHNARKELAMLAPYMAMSFADSAYNEAELKEVGYQNTVVCPILVDLEEYHRPADPATLERLRRQRERTGPHWLFVGRLAPNKCQHDVIGAFAAYRKFFDAKARLTLVGGGTSPHYMRALQLLVAELDLEGSVELLGGLSDAELLAHWAVADVFVCLSEHEGFNVPALEAMELGVPVVAYNAGAVPETLGGAGIVVADKDPLVVAAAVDQACREGPERDRMIAAGRERAADFDLTKTSKILLAGIEANLDA